MQIDDLLVIGSISLPYSISFNQITNETNEKKKKNRSRAAVSDNTSLYIEKKCVIDN